MATCIGTVESLYVYGAKSMQGSRLPSIQIGHPGVIGDRQIVVIDRDRQQVITAKQVGGQGLLNCEAFTQTDGTTYIKAAGQNQEAFDWRDPQAQVTLYELLGRPVTLASVAGYSRPRPTNAGFSLPSGVGYDSSPVHLVTTASLKAAAALYTNPGAFSPLRLRPNIVIRTPDDVTGFIEDDWVGQTLTFPSGLVLGIAQATKRCALTTRPQAIHGLTSDSGVLQTLKHHHRKCLGVYAYVIYAGGETVEEHDDVVLG